MRRYQLLQMAATGAGVPTLNQSVATLRFFFRVTLGRDDIVNHTQFVRQPRMPAGSKLWLTGWTRAIAGGEFVSILVEVADEGGRPRQ